MKLIHLIILFCKKYFLLHIYLYQKCKGGILMAKVIDTVSLTIEVESGKDQAGDSIFKKKTFGNVKSDVNVDSLAAVATAIKGVISVPTGSSYIVETSTI
jgi:hypothetical protein